LNTQYINSVLKYSVNNIMSYKELNLKRPAIKRRAGIDAT